MKYTFSLFIITLFTLSVSAQLTPPVWKINTIAGNGTQGFGGDGMVATNAMFNGPIGVDLDSAGNFYIIDYFNYRIRKVNIATGNISTVAGNGSWGNTGDGGLGAGATINPRAMAVDKKGNIYIADEAFSVIRKVNPITGIITRYAGTGAFGHSGDGGPALSATMRSPYGLALDAVGNLYVAEAGNHIIRKITPGGIISTVAGNDTAGYAGDLGLATHARLDSPVAVAVDRIGNIYISDHRNNVIRKVDTANIITTITGLYSFYGDFGDGGPAAMALINGPRGITLDSIGNLYFCDADNHVIRKIDTAKNINTVVGTGFEGFGGDLGLAIGSNLDNPYDIIIDKWGSLYIADANNHRIRKVYNAALGVSEAAKSDIKVYPNPASDNITVTGLAKDDRITICDMIGRVEFTYVATTTDNRPFIIRKLTPGNYVMYVTDNAGTKKAAFQLVKE